MAVRTVLALALVVVGAAAAAPSVAQPTLENYYREGSVYARDQSVFVERTVLNEPTVNKVKELLDQIDGEKSLVLSDIPGGVALQDQRLSWVVQELPVTVKGSCFSACALVALSAKSLKLMPSGRADRPTLLVIHGSFRIKDGTWSSAGLKNLELLAERLPAIPRAEIERALSFKTSINAGLYIYENATDAPLKSDSVAYVCEEFPAKCSDLGIPDLAKLNIQRARPASGAAAP